MQSWMLNDGTVRQKLYVLNDRLRYCKVLSRERLRETNSRSEMAWLRIVLVQQ